MKNNMNKFDIFLCILFMNIFFNWVNFIEGVGVKNKFCRYLGVLEKKKKEKSKGCVKYGKNFYFF